ncbi:MAG: flagellar hook-associated protein FlgL [Nitrospirae bacterium]|nr:flagellar hook-associated protein FlgL [Nitrospirota bacterium]
MSFLRVTQNLMFRNINTDIQRNYNRLALDQMKLGSAKRVNKPSDDPVSIAQIMEFRKTIREVDQFDRNIEQARRFLQSSDSTLDSVHTMLVRGKQLAIQAANTPLSDSARDGMAKEVEEMQNELVKLANSRQNGQYLFGGSNTKTATFVTRTLSENVSTTENTRFRVVTYNGQGVDVSDANDIDTDSLTAGSTTDELPDATSSVAAGNIANATFYTTTGAPVATFGAGATQNQVRTLPKFFDPLEVQITFGNNGRLQINETGRIFTGDGTNDDGDSEVNLFKTLDDFRIALENNSLGAGGVGGIQARISEFDYGMDTIREAQARIGSRLNRVEQAGSAHENIRLSVQESLSKQEDLDIAATITDLQLAQVVYQAALASAGRILPLSLLNFI